MSKKLSNTSQALRVECSDLSWFGTTRTMNSSLWFVNNKPLEREILGHLAKYQAKYEVTIYAFVIQGNHYHLLANFPLPNKSQFFRDFNARITEAVRRHVPSFPGGKLWARRYSAEAVPRDIDIEKQFFYSALQPVQAGLCSTISQYPGYNSFKYAISGIKEKFKFFDRAAYNSRKRFNKKLTLRDFTEIHSLTYTRLPGYENLSQKNYKQKMLRLLENKRQEIIKERKKNNQGFLGRETLLKIKPGTKPNSTKTSTTDSFRPLVLTLCQETKKRFLEWYFAIREAYDEASRKYRLGEIDVEFPPGTHKPPNLALKKVLF